MGNSSIIPRVIVSSKLESPPTFGVVLTLVSTRLPHTVHRVFYNTSNIIPGVYKPFHRRQKVKYTRVIFIRKVFALYLNRP